LKFSALVERVTKKPVPTHVTHFVVEVMASDEDGEDVEVRIRNCSSRHLFPIPTVYAGPLHRRTQVGGAKGQKQILCNCSHFRKIEQLCIVILVSHLENGEHGRITCMLAIIVIHFVTGAQNPTSTKG